MFSAQLAAAAQNVRDIFLLQLAWPEASSPHVIYFFYKAGEEISRMFQVFVLLALCTLTFPLPPGGRVLIRKNLLLYSFSWNILKETPATTPSLSLQIALLNMSAWTTASNTDKKGKRPGRKAEGKMQAPFPARTVCSDAQTLDCPAFFCGCGLCSSWPFLS